MAKAIFNRAVKWKLLASSPFEDLKPGSQVNPARSRCITVEEADKPFQNMRASCETDWSSKYPTHEFAKWMGHSPAVAAKHYLQSREIHFRSATGSGPWLTGSAQDVAQSVAPTVQNRLQLASAVDGTCSACEVATPETQRGCTDVSESVQPRAVPSDGRYWIRTSDPTRVMRVL